LCDLEGSKQGNRGRGRGRGREKEREKERKREKERERERERVSSKHNELRDATLSELQTFNIKSVNK